MDSWLLAHASHGVAVVCLEAERVNRDGDVVLVAVLHFAVHIKLSLSMSVSVVIDFIRQFVSIYNEGN